ncbi:MAG TPA: substrate-binding periplasmic protein [Cyclobacteriaceae bacterium]
MRNLAIIFLCLSHFCVNSQSPDTLKIGYYNSPPFVIENDNGKLNGISHWLWEEIMKDLNIPYRLIEMPLDDMIEAINNKDIDLGLNPLTITSQRSKTMDFTHPYFVSNSTTLIRETSAINKGLQFIGSFFSLNFFRAVFALFLVILIFGLLVWVFERKHNKDEFDPSLKGIWSGIWWSAVTMTTVGYGDKSPRSSAGRIIALIWMFAAIIIISGFTASIASSLTVNQLSWNQNNVMDFKEKEIGTISSSATLNWLEKKFFKEINSYSSVAEAVNALKNKQIEAFMYDEPIMEYLINQEENFKGLEKLPIRFNLQLYSFGMSENLSENIQEEISNRLVEITESTDWETLLNEYDLSKI